jgi:hypothetical protein
LITYIDDCLYKVSSEKIENKFTKHLKERFDLELQGYSHWFLGTRLYREEDKSYLLDQENYIKQMLNQYCGKETLWGLPPMQNTPAPIDYIYSKENRPKSEEDQVMIKKRYKGLLTALAISSLLYTALNTRCDILWITNKLAKSCMNPGIKDFKALLHVFGYLQKHSDYSIKLYSNIKDSLVWHICKKYNIRTMDIIGFSDSSWQDCPDTGQSTCGFKVFVQGGLIDAQPTSPVTVALSSAEAEYMGACNLGTIVCHLRDLMYELKALGTHDYNKKKKDKKLPLTVLLIDNQATLMISKNYKVTVKNRHVVRQWHFVGCGVKDKLFILKWIPGEDQLADDMTKTQLASKSKLHFERTLMKIPDKVKGFKSNMIGNR